MTMDLRTVLEVKSRVFHNVEVEKVMNPIANLELAVSVELKFVKLIKSPFSLTKKRNL